MRSRDAVDTVISRSRDILDKAILRSREFLEGSTGRSRDSEVTGDTAEDAEVRFNIKFTATISDINNDNDTDTDNNNDTYDDANTNTENKVNVINDSENKTTLNSVSNADIDASIDVKQLAMKQRTYK